MLRVWHVFADVKTTADLSLPAPALWARDDGRRLPETVLIPASPQIAAYLADLGERAEAVRARRVSPEQDNMLKISTDGRKAALDMRLVSSQPPSTTCKLAVAAARIARIWSEHRDRVYRDPASSNPSPVPGALQIVFCDLGTPREQWNAYDELRHQLVARGVPREHIRFIHEASSSQEKARLFAAARQGQVAVLLGSTQKMGVGTNVQARAIALHHIDCPWRPADIEQREGRILRQGNQNPEVGIYRYVVEGSFDAYSWQTVERKAKFIAQITQGRLEQRAIEDIADSTLSFAEVKALASGDPLILDKAQADAELTRLARLHRAHQQNQQNLRHTIPAAEQQQDLRSRQLAAVNAAIARRRDTRGERFQMTIAGRVLSTRPDAAAQLKAWALHHARRAGPRRGEIDLGPLGGLQIHATLRASPEESVLLLALHELPVEPAQVQIHQLPEHAISLVRHLEHRVSDLPALAQRLAESQRAAADEAAQARESLRQPFKHADAYAAAQARNAQIAEQMRQRQQQQAGAPDLGASDNPGTVHDASFPSPPARAVTVAPARPAHAGTLGPRASRFDPHDRKPGAEGRPSDLQR